MVKRTRSWFQAPGASLIMPALVLLAASVWRPAPSFAQLPAGTPTYNVNAKWVTDRGSQVFNVKAYGAKCDGATDDAAAIQAAENAAFPNPTTNYPSANTVLIPGGCAIGSSITIYGILQGTGIGTPTGGGSYLKWVGPAGQPMVLITSHGASVRDLHFIGNSSAAPSEAIQISTSPNTSVNYGDMGTIRDVYIGYIGGDPDTGNQFTNGISWNGTAGGDSFWLSNVYVRGCTGNGINNPNANASDMHIENLYVTRCGHGFDSYGQEIYGTNWEFGFNSVDLYLENASDTNIKGFASTSGSTQMIVNNGGRLVIDGGSFYEANGSGTVNIIDNSQGAAGYVTIRNFNFLWNPGFTGTETILACPTSGPQPSDLRLINTTGITPSMISCPYNWAQLPPPAGIIDYEPRDGWGAYKTDSLNVISKVTGAVFDWTRHDLEHQYYFWGGPLELIQVPGGLIGSTCTPTGTGSTSYGYRVTATTGNLLGTGSGAVSIGGETTPNSEVTCSNASTLSSTSYNTINIYPVIGASAYNIYCRTPGAEQLCATVPAVGSPSGSYTWVDNGSVTPSGTMPAANTTGRLVGGSLNSSYSYTKNLDIGADGHVTGTAGSFSSLKDTGLVSQGVLGTDSQGNLQAGTAVQSVGATSPLQSSGGVNPIISCPTCATSTAGSTTGGLLGTYLSLTSGATNIPWFSAAQQGPGLYSFGMLVGGLTAYLSSANGVGSLWQVGLEFYKGTTAFDQGPYLGIGPNAAAGAYQDANLPSWYVGADTLTSLATYSVVPSGTTQGTLLMATANIQGTTSQMVGQIPGSGGATVAASTTAFQGPSQNTGLTGTTESAYFVPVPYATTAQHLCVYLSSAQSSTGSLAVTLRDTPSPYSTTSSTSLAVTIAASAGAGTYCDNTDTASIGAGDAIDWQITNNATATSGSIGYISMELTNPGAATTGLVIFGSASTNVNNGYFWAPFTRHNSTTESANQAPAPRSFNARNLYCYITGAPSGSNTETMTLRDNGANTTLAAISTSSSTGASAMVSDTTHTVSISTKDLFDLGTTSTTSGTLTFSACTMEVD
jgi:hypothetical protein